MCPATLSTCKADALCTAAMDWNVNVCTDKCKQINYTNGGDSAQTPDVSCSKNCDTLARDNNFTSSSTSKDIFDN